VDRDEGDRYSVPPNDRKNVVMISRFREHSRLIRAGLASYARALTACFDVPDESRLPLRTCCTAPTSKPHTKRDTDNGGNPSAALTRYCFIELQKRYLGSVPLRQILMMAG